MIQLKIGYSPCPNDTFIMAALAETRIHRSLALKPVLADVETLNQWALEERLEVTKLSFFALGRMLSSYGLLYSGAALGRGCGPLVVARPGFKLSHLARGMVAAPGELTTARLLLSLYLGQEPRFQQMVFSEIMPAVSSGKAEFGLIIHEGRFTFPDYGLEAVLDLGQWWEEETGRPIPLGGIAIRRDQGPELAKRVDKAIRASLLMARKDFETTMKYVLAHAQEMTYEVVQQHIDLYVNAFTMDIGQEGRKAVETLFNRAAEKGLILHANIPLMAY